MGDGCPYPGQPICNALQRTATRCNTLQRAATHCNALQRAATHCNALKRAATHCNALQHDAAIHCNTVGETEKLRAVGAMNALIQLNPDAQLAFIQVCVCVCV